MLCYSYLALIIRPPPSTSNFSTRLILIGRLSHSNASLPLAHNFDHHLTAFIGTELHVSSTRVTRCPVNIPKFWGSQASNHTVWLSSRSPSSYFIPLHHLQAPTGVLDRDCQYREWMQHLPEFFWIIFSSTLGMMVSSKSTLVSFEE